MPAARTVGIVDDVTRTGIRPVAPLGGETRQSLEALSTVLGTATPPTYPASLVPAPLTRTGQAASAPVLDGPPAPQSAEPARADERSRMAWMDVLRGTAILMVVMTHVLAQGWRLFDIEETPLNIASWTVAPVRIPLLMLLSGMLLSRSIAKGPRLFVAGKLRGIAWPYVVWSLIYLGVWQLDPAIDGGSHGGAGLVDILVEPVSVLWYLHLLLGLYLLALVLLSLPRARPWHLVSALAVTWGLVSLGDSAEWERALCLATFFLGGDMLARRLDRGLPTTVTRLWSSPLRRPATLIALLVLASPLLLWAIMPMPARYAPYSAVPALAMMVLFVLAARALSGSPIERSLAWVGRQSLVFYVTHWLLIGAAYAALDALIDPGEHPYATVALVFCATLAACALVARLQQVWRPAGWLFAAPRRRPAGRDRVQG